MKKSYLTAKDVSDITGVKKAKAYEIIRGLREKSFDVLSLGATPTRLSTSEKK